MSNEKKKRQAEEQAAPTAAQSYSAAGLGSRSEVQNALAGAEYRPSQSVTDAEKEWKQWQARRPEAYESPYQSRMDAVLEDLLGRESFGYSYALDPLYRQYARQYAQNAQNASADAAAQAAALTGGYGSSYAASVAQQAYQQQMGGLNDALPTLYRLALDTYNSEGDALVETLDQLDAREQNAQSRYQNELADYYTQLDQKGEAYNDAYAKDYGQYQDYLSQLDTLYGYYAAQEQAAANQKQQRFNRVMSVLGLIGDAVQLVLSGTTGLGTLAGSLASTGYNIKASERAYAADRADTAWNQQMQQLQRQDSLNQQQYKNEQAQRQYQDALRQQAFENDVTSQKLNLAKAEWAAKQTKAAQAAQKAAANAGAKNAGLNESSSLLTGTRSNVVPYSAARLRSQGRSDGVIRSQLMKEGYSEEDIREILKNMNR